MGTACDDIWAKVRRAVACRLKELPERLMLHVSRSGVRDGSGMPPWEAGCGDQSTLDKLVRAGPANPE
jgi:hypothetical protein